MTEKNSPIPDPDEPNTPDSPIEQRIDVVPGEPVSFEVPANTNLVINVVSARPRGFLSSVFSTLGCLASGIFWTVVVLLIIAWLTP